MQRNGFLCGHLCPLMYVAVLCLGGCLSKPELPIIVIYEVKSVSQEVRVFLENQSTRGMWVSVEFSNVRQGLSHQSRLFIPGGGREAVGWRDGWKFERGECVLLVHKDFRQKTVCLE